MINKRNEIENILNKLSKSNFRNKFHLKEKDKEYIKEKGRQKDIATLFLLTKKKKTRLEKFLKITIY